MDNYVNNESQGFSSRNKLLLILSFFNFFIIYGSSFVPGYEYFIDEVYYIACANHLAFGYIDHPPLSIFILAFWKSIFGDSLYSIRFLPALAGSFIVFFGGIITRELGGGKFSQVLTSFTLLCTPVFAAAAGIYSMNIFETLLAVLIIYYIIRLMKEHNLKRWFVIGVLMGLGVMNKHTFGLYIMALLIGLLVCGKWRLIFNKWFIFGGLIAFIIFLPNIIWQIVNHYPSLEFYVIISRYKNVYTPPLSFITGQIVTMSPINFFVWFFGIFFLLFSKQMKDYRFMVVIFLLIFIFMLLTGTSRSDRTAFIYPAAFAGGAIFWETFTSKHRTAWIKLVLIFLMVLSFAMTIPIILPYLTYQQTADYIKFIHYNTEFESHNRPLLPQLLADRIGWKEKAVMMNSVYQTLSDSEKKRTILSATNYGQAGMLDLYGKKYGFPKVICGHNSYSLWNREHLDADIVLYLAHKKDTVEVSKRFGNYKMSDQIFTNSYVTPHEDNLVVYICKEPRLPLDTLRDKGRFYY